MGFSRGHQGNQKYRPHNDDNEEEDNQVEDNDKDDNNVMGSSAQGLDRNTGFSREHQVHKGHRPHDDEEEDDEEMEDNNHDKVISALELDRDMVFARTSRKSRTSAS